MVTQRLSLTAVGILALLALVPEASTRTAKRNMCRSASPTDRVRLLVSQVADRGRPLRALGDMVR